VIAGWVIGIIILAVIIGLLILAAIIGIVILTVIIVGFILVLRWLIRLVFGKSSTSKVSG